MLPDLSPACSSAFKAQRLVEPGRAGVKKGAPQNLETRCIDARKLRTPRALRCQGFKNPDRISLRILNLVIPPKCRR